MTQKQNDWLKTTDAGIKILTAVDDERMEGLEISSFSSPLLFINNRAKTSKYN